VETQTRQNALDQQRKFQNDLFNANEIYQYTTRPGPDGSVQFDEEKLPGMVQKMSAAGINPDVVEHFAGAYKGMNQTMSSFRDTQLKHQADFANYMLQSASPEHPLTPATSLAAAKVAQANGLANADDINKMMAAFNQGKDPTEVFKAIANYGKVGQPQKFGTVGAGGSIYNEGTGQITSTAPKEATQKTLEQKSVTLDGKPGLVLFDPDPKAPVKYFDLDGKPLANAAQRLSAVETTPKDTSAEMDAAYQRIVAKQAQGQPITAQEAADKKAYETRKLLGPEAAAANAANRAATAAAGTNSRLDRTQAFQEAQAGRKELTDKVEQPYLDAKEKAATLRSVIEAAKNGNMAAGNVQSLLATLGLVTMEGVKRINTTELESVQGAGSLLERLKGEVGGIVSGKPLSPKIQQDLTQMATLLEQSARKKYEQGFKQITGRYGLKDEQLLPSEVPGSISALPPVPAGMIRAFDPQGNPHLAKQGTPLPTGWTLAK
jgi:hypothetical protein